MKIHFELDSEDIQKLKKSIKREFKSLMKFFELAMNQPELIDRFASFFDEIDPKKTRKKKRARRAEAN